jgi:hypothetical protein
LTAAAVTLCFVMGGLLLTGASGAVGAGAGLTKYYVDSAATCPGSGTHAAPWCDFRVLDTQSFKPGDELLLKRGDTFKSGLTLLGSGTRTNYLTVGAYGSGPRPVINGNGDSRFIGINLYDNSYVQIENVSVQNAGTGILINDPSNQTGYRFLGLYLSGDGLGIQSPAGTNQGTASNILVQDVEGASNKLSCGYSKCEGGTLVLGGVSNVIVNRLYSHDSCEATSWGLGTGASNVVIENSVSAHDGDCGSELGVTANYVDQDTNVTYVNDIVTNVPHVGPVDFSAIGIEPSDGPDSGINVEDDYIAHNAGPGIQILGRPSPTTQAHISGNVLSGNSYQYGTVPYPILGQIWTDIWIPGSVNGTGTIDNNLYYAPSITGAFEEAHGAGNFDGFAQSNNLEVGAGSNVWYGANGFSCTTQGAHRWSYQRSTDNSSWTNLSRCATVHSLDQKWTAGGSRSGFVSNFEEFPPARRSSWVARSWTSPAAGRVSVRGRVLMSNPACGSGVTAEITKNGSSKPIWGPRTISASHAAGVSSDLDGISVQAGDMLHFAVQKKGSTQCRVSWTPSVAIGRLHPSGLRSIRTQPGGR